MPRFLKAFVFIALPITLGAQPPQPAELAPRETTNGVLFQCSAPGAQRVYLAASFNTFANNRNGRIEDEQFAMEGPDRNGVFQKTVSLPPGLYRYKFAIEGDTWTWFIPDYARQRDDEGNAYLLVDGTPDESTNARTASPPFSKEGLVTFELFAPDAHMVYLAGSFNQWARNNQGRVTDLRFAMRGPDESGIWRAKLPLARGRHEYQFVIDGRDWITDPLATESTANHHSIMEIR